MMKNQYNKKIARPRVLIVGCGDVGMRILPLLAPVYRVFALTSQAERCAELRDKGAIPLLGDLDEPATLVRIARLASLIIYLAPPHSTGRLDTRSRHLATMLGNRCDLRYHSRCHLVYVSTSGVYGDCRGEIVDETRKVQPRNARAVRRVDAEQIWRKWARRTGSALSILRVPGIYSASRLPLERLERGTPALVPEQDVYTNHIHADDLARLIVNALSHGAPNRIYHAVDHSDLLMGDYFDLVADEFKKPRPPRCDRTEVQRQVSPMLWSFMSESRRLTNRRIVEELGFRFRFPHVIDGMNDGKDDKFSE